jgi:NAD(P)-dependent dehydrogenase (short-subunit alcohol dehydrogenase family)
MKNIIITGASSGLGAAIARSLGHNVINWSYECGVDVQDSKSIEAAFNALSCGPIDILVNCAGVNHIDYIPDMKEEDWNLVMDTNAKGIFLVSQALLPVLKGGIAYNASKGAAEIMTRQMARELKKTHDITTFGISPNKLSGTGMSEYIDKRVCEVRGWTKEEARAYQLAALPAGEETDPATLAEFIAFLLSTKERHKYLNGCIIPYGGPV